jgi:hypothetical protein
MALDIYFMNVWYIREEFYQQIGLNDTKKLYNEAIKNYKKNTFKNFSSKEWLEIIKKYRLITPFNKFFIRFFTGISW